MGIVNVTPDSFSGDGLLDPRAASALAEQHVRAGADIIDIGAESTRPGHEAIDEETETARLLPVLRAVRERFADAVISVDTYKPAVFEAAIDAGADMLNCIWGLPHALLGIAARAGAPVIAMHNRMNTSYDGPVIDSVVSFLKEASQRALAAGVEKDAILLDPGIGFGKTADQNLEVMRDLRKLAALGFPIVLGTSRKSTLGKVTGKPPEQRVFATAATLALGVQAGVDVVRVHDVEAAHDVVRVADAVVRGWRPAQWTS